MNRIRKCPFCGRTFTDAPALSRRDNQTAICPQCGTREAFEAAGISPAGGEAILKEIYGENAGYDAGTDKPPLWDNEISRILMGGEEQALKKKLCDYGWVRERLTLRLQRWEKNQDRLRKLVHRPFHEFAITSHVQLGSYGGSEAWAGITKMNLLNLGISEEQLFTDALRSACKRMPAKVMPIMEVLSELAGIDGSGIAESGPAEITVITNEASLYGASAILYPGVVEGIADEKQADLILLPSSVHEWLCMSAESGLRPADLAEMVRTVNRDVVSPGEVLSDHLYYYDRGRKEIRMLETE